MYGGMFVLFSGLKNSRGEVGLIDRVGEELSFQGQANVAIELSATGSVRDVEVIASV